MKSLQSFLNKEPDYIPCYNEHKRAYNQLLKWYNNATKEMSKEEVIDILVNAVICFQDDDLEPMK